MCKGASPMLFVDPKETGYLDTGKHDENALIQARERIDKYARENLHFSEVDEADKPKNKNSKVYKRKKETKIDEKSPSEELDELLDDKDFFL